VRAVVDLTRCQGYAQCAFLAPDAFRMQGDEALWYDPEPDDVLREQVLRAAAACPVQALIVTPTDPCALPIPPVANHSSNGHGGNSTGHVGNSNGHSGNGAAKNGHSPQGISGTLAADTDAFRKTGRIVIVGASLAGLRAGALLRREGFAGSLTLIGDEAREPYDRPPLSKQVVDGWVDARHTALPRPGDLDAHWRLGVAATGLDPRRKQVLLADGTEVPFDRLLIATGTRARPWPKPEQAALDGVFALRGADDAAELHRRLLARPSRVLVIGGGFTGSELAASCRALGLPVTLTERGPVPLGGALGQAVGAVAADLHRDHGVDLRCDVTVTDLEGDDDGQLRRAHLSDGTVLDVEVAVVALGSIRNVEWLEGSGLAAGPWGVGCDTGCRAFTVDGMVTDDVFVAGDVARCPHPVYDYQFLALEHWGNAVTQGEIAAHNMIHPSTERWPHLAIPSFWSTQYGIEIKSVGVPTFADEVVIAQGSVAERRFVAVYGKHGRITAAVAFDQGRWLEFYEGMIKRAAPFPPDFHTVNEAVGERPQPAGIADHPMLIRQATVMVTGHSPAQRRAQFVPRDC
jgi:NADPH-dependent 2,4-dienoyl-CoA reductase/sulfur reductase-like enzyme/ferredoxin